MSGDETDDQAKPAETEETAASAAMEDRAAEPAEDPGTAADPDAQALRRRILIGSQRDPAAYRARQIRDWVPLPDPDGEDATQEAAEKEVPQQPVAEAESPPQEPTVEPTQKRPFPPPNIRDRLPPDLEDEFDQALGDASLEELMAGDDSPGSQTMLEEQSQHTGRVVAVRRDDVFVELGSPEQGCLSLKLLDEPPDVGTTLEVVVQRFNPEDGLYDLTLPNAAVEVDDWADLKEGMLVEARVTGHNTGGLECEVGHLRGFIPVSQIALYRVEDLAEFADEKFTCLITEADPQRRNLVLSRRAVLQREKEEAREEFLASLQPGQIHEGVVRKLVDFGAFVDIGGIDGLLHISQLAWGRLEHPREVLSEGQAIKVKIEKLDRQTGRLSLAYRDMLENPWDRAQHNYPPNSVVEGTVTKLMEFGAFVELEPGVEGLVHISELSHKRVPRVSDVVREGNKVQVLVLSVDPKAQRISLSIKQALAEPESDEKQEDREGEPLPSRRPKPKRPDQPLRGGLGKISGGQKFGLKW